MSCQNKSVVFVLRDQAVNFSCNILFNHVFPMWSISPLRAHYLSTLPSLEAHMCEAISVRCLKPIATLLQSICHAALTVQLILFHQSPLSSSHFTVDVILTPDRSYKNKNPHKSFKPCLAKGLALLQESFHWMSEVFYVCPVRVSTHCQQL